MEEKALKPKRSYIHSTANNYQSRYQSFSAWANEDKNAKPAKKCRELLIHFLSLRISQHLLTENSTLLDYTNITLVDAGCGPGRDLKEFSRCQVTIPLTSTYSKPSGANILKTCFNESCYVCKRKPPTHHETSNVVMHQSNIEPIGFDTCAGFVDECRQIGLNVVLSDFVNFFQNTKGTSVEQKIRGKFHSIFALASLFHLPSVELQMVLELFKSNLNPDVGVLLTSIPGGSRDELGSDGRWSLNLSGSKQKEMLEKAGFEVIFEEQMSIYNGSNWIVLVSVIKR